MHAEVRKREKSRGGEAGFKSASLVILALLKGGKGLHHLAAEGGHLFFGQHGPVQGVDDIFQRLGIVGLGLEDRNGLGNDFSDIE